MQRREERPGTTASSFAFGWHFVEALNLLVTETDRNDQVGSEQIQSCIRDLIGGAAFTIIQSELRRRGFIFLETLEADGLIEVTHRHGRGLEEVGFKDAILRFKMSDQLRASRLLFRHPRSQLSSRAAELVEGMSVPVMDRGGVPITNFAEFVREQVGELSTNRRTTLLGSMEAHGFLEKFGQPKHGRPRLLQVPLSHAFRPVRSIGRAESDTRRDVEADFTRFAFIPFRAMQLYYVILYMMPKGDSFVNTGDINRAWRAVTGRNKIAAKTRDALFKNRILMLDVQDGQRRFKVLPEGSVELVRTAHRPGDALDREEIVRICGLVTPDKLPVVCESWVLSDQPLEEDAVMTCRLPNRAYTLLMLVFYLQSVGERPNSARLNVAYRELTGLAKIHPGPIQLLIKLNLMTRTGPKGSYIYTVLVDPQTVRILITGSGVKTARYSLVQIQAKFGPMPGLVRTDPSILDDAPDVAEGLSTELGQYYSWIGENLEAIEDPEVEALMEAAEQAAEKMASSLVDLGAALRRILDLRRERRARLALKGLQKEGE
jgi:hypothetical protein